MPALIVVVGGGILGAATAAALARLGARPTLVTARHLAHGASGRSLAWVNAFGPYEPEYVQLRLAGIERYRALDDAALDDAALDDAALDAALLESPAVHLDGAVTWGEQARADHERLRNAGYAVRWLTRDEVAEVLPGVEPAAVAEEGALLTPGEGWVDLPRLVARLAQDVVRHGGQVRVDAGRVEPVLDKGRVVGVTLADGSLLAADAVVLATGADVPATLRRLGAPVPDSTLPALLVRTAPGQTPLRAVVNAPRVSLRPTGDGGVAFDSAWSERRVARRGDGSYAFPEETVGELVAEARAVLAGRPDLNVAAVCVGEKPVPGDGRPVVGGVPGVPGLYVAFTHSGATLGLVVGDLLAAEVLSGERNAMLAPYRPERFL